MEKEYLTEEKKNVLKKKKSKRFKSLIPKQFLFKPSQKFKFREKSYKDRFIFLIKKIKNIFFKDNPKDNKSNNINERKNNKKKVSTKYEHKNIFKCNINISRIILFVFNITILVLNIYYLINILISTSEKNKLFFKFSESFNFNLFLKPYKDISLYLNNKFKPIDLDLNNTKIKSKSPDKIKKELKIKMVGLYEIDFHHKWLKNKLEDEFEIKYVKRNPDYLIYNTRTSQDRTEYYPDAIRIAFYTENIMPDINYADYIMAHYHINYLDKYLKTNIFFYEDFSKINKARKEVLKNPIRTNFCGAVISNCKADFRLKFFKKLNKYKLVDMGGGCGSKKVENKIEFLKKYKFSLSMENSDGDGYITEKIVHALQAGTIPIYYGDYLVDEYINPKTYILIKGEKDIKAKIEYIKKIDNDDNLYRKIMKEKPIIDNKFIEKIDGEETKEFLKNIFRQDKNKAFRRDENFYDFNC